MSKEAVAKIVDARGQLCPKPLILAKRGLSELAGNEFLELLIDNETSKENVERFFSDNNINFQTSSNAGEFTLRASKSSHELSHPEAEDYCSLPLKEEKASKQQKVFCIKSSTMGDGPRELGEILIRACLNTIKEVSPLPNSLVFYNSGVELTLEDSPAVESLKELEAKGIKILVCGTCLDYFSAKEKLAVGTVSNMYSILEELAAASSVVYP